MCYVAEGVWIGVLLVISSSLGLGAVWRGAKIRSKCLFIAYFVCTIVACLFTTGLLIVSVIYATITNGAYGRYIETYLQ